MELILTVKSTLEMKTRVIISTGAIDGGPQGYQGSLWFGTSDHPAGGSTVNGSGTQFNWSVAGIASKTDQDTGGQNTSYGNLEFYTKGLNNTASAALAMTIDESQNVGIGTNTPGHKLSVTDTTSGFHFPVAIGGGTHLAGSGVGIAFDPEGYQGEGYVHSALVIAGAGYGYNRGDFHFLLNHTAANSQTTNLTHSRMVIKSDTGNVGIGVTDPEKKLEVKSDTTYDGILIDVLSAPEIRLRDRGNSDTLIGTGRHQLDGFHIDTYSGNALFIEGSTREVGIGSTSPAAQLHIRKNAGLNTTVELLRLDCGDTTHVGGKAGKIVFTDISVYNSTAEITAARVGVSSCFILEV